MSDTPFGYSYYLDMYNCRVGAANDLKCLYGEQSYPKKTDTKQYDCCGGTKTVTDARFGKQYPCPKCIAPVAKNTLEEAFE